MADRWLYIHANRAFGPVARDKLAQLAAEGKLLPDDLVWPEGTDSDRAIPASSLLDAATFARPASAGAIAPALAANPDWLAGKKPAPGAAPDWLGDVEKPAEPIAPVIMPIDETKPAKPKPPAKPKAAPARRAPHPRGNDEDTRPPSNFPRRALILVAIGIVALALAVGFGLCLAGLTKHFLLSTPVPVEEEQ